MSSYGAAAATAFILGLQSALAPCPMTENIVAISFLARRADRPGRVLLAGLLYTAGQALAYIAVALLLLQAVFAEAEIALFLARWLTRLLGPVLILVGMVLLNLLSFPFGSGGLSDKWQQRIARLGLAGPAVLGFIFGLDCCPTTAAYFFGLLIPSCLQHHDAVLLPFLYALGTTLPVIGFAALLAFAAHRIGTAFNALTVVERWARRIAGVLAIVVGVYQSLIQVYGIFDFRF
ncbi:MAG: aromatic aminobenezylarsenical efflux permease ArsG family transporter [Planctomycetota bacterium]